MAEFSKTEYVEVSVDTDIVITPKEYFEEMSDDEIIEMRKLCTNNELNTELLRDKEYIDSFIYNIKHIESEYLQYIIDDLEYHQKFKSAEKEYYSDRLV